MPPRLLIIGCGEYVCGTDTSDKSLGVVALVALHLKEQGHLSQVGIAGRRVASVAAARKRIARISKSYSNLQDVSVAGFPSCAEAEGDDAFEEALRGDKPFLRRGDAAAIFTPDPFHAPIARRLIQAGIHVLITKPVVQRLDELYTLTDALRGTPVHSHVELHKRFDPLYADAITKAQSPTDFGHLTHFHGYMSQPRAQLQTFAAWAGRSSDISYYLNSHHVDVLLCMALRQGLVPTTVSAVGARGVASRELPNAPQSIEDAITLCISLRDPATGRAASGVLTSCWTAPRSDVHSQQRFFAVGSAGQIEIDQARRGYSHSTDARGYASVNPLFMKYTPAPDGSFDGALGYGYRSIAHFVRAVAWGEADDVSRLAAVNSPEVEWATAILEAGRRSLDADGAKVTLARSPESDGRITLTVDGVDSTTATASSGGSSKRARDE